MPWRISFPSATIVRSIPALSKDTSVSFTYSRSAEASGIKVVGHAAGGGCLFGSAHESLARIQSLKISHCPRETYEKWKSRYILYPLLWKRLASSKLYSNPLVPPSGFTHILNRTVFIPPSPSISSAGLVWLCCVVSLYMLPASTSVFKELRSCPLKKNG
jgi:hypothetical protein